MEEGNSRDGSGTNFDFVGGVFGDELLEVDEFCEHLVVGDEIEGAESLRNFIIGATREIRGADWNAFEMVTDEKKIGSEKLSELIKVDGFYWVGGCGSFWVLWGVGALVAEGGESGDEETKKLLVGGKILDGGVKIIVQFFVENARGFAEGLTAFGKERDFGDGVGGVRGGYGVCGMEEVIKVGVGKGGEVKGGVVLKILDEEVEESNGAVERAGGSLDGPFFGKAIGWVGPEGIIDDFKIEEDGGEEGEGKREKIVRIGDEPMIGRSGDAPREVFEVLMVEMNMLGVVGDKGASLTNVGEGREGGLSGGAEGG